MTLSMPVKTLIAGAVAFVLAYFITGAAIAQTDAGPAAQIALTAPGGVVEPEPATGIGTSPAHVDVIDDPGGAAKEITGAFASGLYALGVVLGLLALSRLYLWACARLDLGTYEAAAPYVVTASGVLTAIAASIAATGDVHWKAVLGALAMAAALYLTPRKVTT